MMRMSRDYLRKLLDGEVVEPVSRFEAAQREKKERNKTVEAIYPVVDPDVENFILSSKEVSVWARDIFYFLRNKNLLNKLSPTEIKKAYDGIKSALVYLTSAYAEVSEYAENMDCFVKEEKIVLPQQIKAVYRESPSRMLCIEFSETVTRLQPRKGPWPSLTNEATVRKKWRLLVDRALQTIENLPSELFSKAVCLFVHEFNERYNKNSDPDNYSVKYIIDALKKNGVIKDDNGNSILIVQTTKPSAEPSTKIYIKEVQDLLKEARKLFPDLVTEKAL